jgi:hypothetical protein
VSLNLLLSSLDLLPPPLRGGKETKLFTLTLPLEGGG